MMYTATEDNVDVLMSGYAFRLKIWHERGLSLLGRESKNFDSIIIVAFLIDSPWMLTFKTCSHM